MSLNVEQIVKALMQQRSQLIGYAWAVVGDPHAAEDVLQDVSMLAVRKCNEINDLEHLSGWLRHAIRLRGMEVRQTLHRRSSPQLSPEILESLEQAYDSLSQADESERMSALRVCLDLLQGTARQVIELRYTQNLKPAEISHHTGQRVETVYKTITRAHGALRECVKQRLNIGEARR